MKSLYCASISRITKRLITYYHGCSFYNRGPTLETKTIDLLNYVTEINLTSIYSLKASNFALKPVDDDTPHAEVTSLMYP